MNEQELVNVSNRSDIFETPNISLVENDGGLVNVSDDINLSQISEIDLVDLSNLEDESAIIFADTPPSSPATDQQMRSVQVTPLPIM